MAVHTENHADGPSTSEPLRYPKPHHFQGLSRDPVLTRTEERMMQDLCAQAALLLDRLTLAEVVQRETTAGHLEHLTPRERKLLELMAQGLTNTAICQQLHLCVKTVEPLISTIFAKLGLHADPTVNRRVLAALEYHRA